MIKVSVDRWLQLLTIHAADPSYYPTYHEAFFPHNNLGFTLIFVSILAVDMSILRSLLNMIKVGYNRKLSSIYELFSGFVVSEVYLIIPISSKICSIRSQR